MTYLGAVDVGGTKITASIANEDGIIVKVRQDTKLEGDNRTIPHQIHYMLDEACSRIKIQGEVLSALGISHCSPFAERDGYRTVVAPNLCGGLAKERGIIPNDWTEIPLEEVLSVAYQDIEIGNDCVTAVVAEYTFGAGLGERDIVYVTWSTGIGGGAYVDGHLLAGKNGNSPHVGHIFLVEDGPQCGCGDKGHLEALAAGSAIARDYGVEDAAEVFQAYGRDPRAKEIIDRAAKFFARGLSSVANMLDTRVFVIGGSVFMNNEELLLPIVEEEFYKTFPIFSQGVEIRPSALDQYLGDIAALSLVMPDDWIEKWRETKPWEKAPEPIQLD